MANKTYRNTCEAKWAKIFADGGSGDEEEEKITSRLTEKDLLSLGKYSKVRLLGGGSMGNAFAVQVKEDFSMRVVKVAHSESLEEQLEQACGDTNEGLNVPFVFDSNGQGDES